MSLAPKPIYTQITYLHNNFLNYLYVEMEARYRQEEDRLKILKEEEK